MAIVEMTSKIGRRVIIISLGKRLANFHILKNINPLRIFALSLKTIEL